MAPGPSRYLRTRSISRDRPISRSEITKIDRPSPPQPGYATTGPVDASSRVRAIALSLLLDEHHFGRAARFSDECEARPIG